MRARAHINHTVDSLSSHERRQGDQQTYLEE